MSVTNRDISKKYDNRIDIIIEVKKKFYIILFGFLLLWLESITTISFLWLPHLFLQQQFLFSKTLVLISHEYISYTPAEPEFFNSFFHTIDSSEHHNTKNKLKSSNIKTKVLK